MEFYQSTIEKLEKNRMEGLPFFFGNIHPFYTGFSIANLPASICRWLEIPTTNHPALDPIIHHMISEPYQHLILLLVDGLSLRVFKRFSDGIYQNGNISEWKSLLDEGLFFPLTSVSPSTTSTALTTLWTGRLPAEHAYIGYELFLKEFGLIANMITHSVASFDKEPVTIKKAGFDPLTFLPVSTLGRHYQKNGIKPFAFQHESISASGLSEMLLKDVDLIPYFDQQDLWTSVTRILSENSNEKILAYIYWSGLDTLSHLEGPDSEPLYQVWLNFARDINHFLSEYRKRTHPKTLFILTADHGQISTEIRPEYDLRNHPDLTRQLHMPPTGESRLPFLCIKKGMQKAVEDYLAAHWEGNFFLMDSSNVLKAGLLGNTQPHQSTIDRIGSHVVIPKKNAYWWWVNKENHLLGRHGGLSRGEMLVPFFALPI